MRNNFGSVVGTTSSKAEGFEIEVTGNPIRGLRLTGNVSFQETTLDNVFPILSGLTGEFNANIQQSGLRDVRSSPMATANNAFFSEEVLC